MTFVNYSEALPYFPSSAPLAERACYWEHKKFGTSGDAIFASLSSMCALLARTLGLANGWTACGEESRAAWCRLPTLLPQANVRANHKISQPSPLEQLLNEQLVDLTTIQDPAGSEIDGLRPAHLTDLHDYVNVGRR